MFYYCSTYGDWQSILAMTLCPVVNQLTLVHYLAYQCPAPNLERCINANKNKSLRLFAWNITV